MSPSSVPNVVNATNSPPQSSLAPETPTSANRSSGRPPALASQSQSGTPSNGSQRPAGTHEHDHLTTAGVVAILLYLALLLPWGFVALLLLALAVGECFIRKAKSTGGSRQGSNGPPQEPDASTLEFGQPEGHGRQQSSAASKHSSNSYVMVQAVTLGNGTVEKFVEWLTGQKPVDCLLPSLSAHQKKLNHEYKEKGNEKMGKIQDEINDCETLIERVRRQRQECLKRTIYQESILDANDNASLGERYAQYTRRSEDLAKHLDTLRADLRTIKSLTETQATFEKTGFHGLADWAKKLEDDHQDLMTAVVSVSFVGAGLTFTTIFSATRGDIGLMCYAWALFNCGFIIPTAAVGLLDWASHRSPTTLFASPKIWSILLTIFIYLSVFAVAAALVLLNVTIIFLHTDWSDNVQMQQPPVPAGAFALCCAAITGVMTILAFVLHYIANGWGRLKDAWLGRPSDKDEGEQQDFNAYVLR